MRTELNHRGNADSPQDEHMRQLGTALALLDAGEMSAAEFGRRVRLIVDRYRQARKFTLRH